MKDVKFWIQLLAIVIVLAGGFFTMSLSYEHRLTTVDGELTQQFSGYLTQIGGIVTQINEVKADVKKIDGKLDCLIDDRLCGHH